MTPSTVIVGASVGGVRTAQALRRAGAGSIEVPLLTRDQASAADVALDLGVRDEGLDLAEHHVILADGRRWSFDDVVLATGASAKPSPCFRWPGS